MQGALFMPARCVVLHGGNTGKVRVISDGWVLAGFEGFDEGRKKSFPFYRISRAFLVLTRSSLCVLSGWQRRVQMPGSSDVVLGDRTRTPRRTQEAKSPP